VLHVQVFGALQAHVTETMFEMADDPEAPTKYEWFLPALINGCLFAFCLYYSLLKKNKIIILVPSSFCLIIDRSVKIALIPWKVVVACMQICFLSFKPVWPPLHLQVWHSFVAFTGRRNGQTGCCVLPAAKRRKGNLVSA